MVEAPEPRSGYALWNAAVVIMARGLQHIIIGGGSAGCAAAARLVEHGERVLLLEAGHHHRHPLLNMPPGVFKLLRKGSKFITRHHSLPQDHLAGRRSEIPQGNVLGGGSTVNGQVYIRGRPGDYDNWHDLLRGNNDAVGWKWDDVLPYFRRVEGNRKFNDEFHGVDGPLSVSDPGHVDDVSHWFVQTLQTQGVPFNPDFNGSRQHGVGYFQFTYNQGRRVSAASAFIDPLKGNPDLTVCLGSQVQKIMIEKGQAVGVTVRERNGTRELRTEGEVILSAGALVTPGILMLSGIGPADQLSSHGIPVLVDLPGVGKNLQDHPDVSIVARLNGRFGYHRQDAGWNMIRNGLEFKLFGSGRITTTGLEAGAFVNPSSPDAPPSHEAYCIPVLYLDDEQRRTIEDGPGVSIQIVLLKPHSRGEVRLASPHPAGMCEFTTNFLRDGRDMAAMIEGLRYFRHTLETRPLSDFVDQIVAPDPDHFSDEALAEHCRRVVKTNFHPCGTAKMGADADPLAVLDSRMRVRNVAGLRVCDMSAAPEIPAGNTNAAAIMLGGRCADLVLNDK